MPRIVESHRVANFPISPSGVLTVTSGKQGLLIWHFTIPSTLFSSAKFLELELLKGYSDFLYSGIYSVSVPNGMIIGSAIRCSGFLYKEQENLIILGESEREFVDRKVLRRTWRSLSKLAIINRQHHPFVLTSISTNFLLVGNRDSFFYTSYLSSFEF